MAGHVRRPEQVPISGPDLGSAEIEAVVDVLRGKALSQGTRVTEFEKRFATYIGAPHAVAVSSGTAGLHLSLIVAGVRDGDAVVTTPFSFIASANVILYERAVPVFVDVTAPSGNIDPAGVHEALEDIAAGGARADRWLPPVLGRAAPRRVAAVLPVHVFGVPAQLKQILHDAQRHAAPVIEDACEAVGAEREGRRVGTFGRAAVFAFYPNKQMTTGEGGVIVTDDPTWDRLLRSLRNQGREGDEVWLSHPRLGFNYRLDEMSAALGIIQLARLEELLAKRARVAGWYLDRLQEVDALEVPSPEVPGGRPSWFVFCVRVRTGIDRERLMQELADDGIPTRPYFQPIHLQPVFRERFGYREGMFPVAERLGRSTLALPFSSTMTEGQVDLVTRHLLAALTRPSVRTP